MNRVIKRVLTVVFFVFVFIPCINASAEVYVPEKVRIGLFFMYTQKNIDTSVSSFTVCAEEGLELGSFVEDKFVKLYEKKDSKKIIIRKDAYFIRSGGSLQECRPDEKNAHSEDKSGPFHIKIGGDYKNYNSVMDEVREIKKKGIAAFPAFVDTWQIWTGFYTDENSAQQAISNVKKKLGKGKYTVIEPSLNRIVTESTDGEVLLLYGSSKGVFQIHPRKENNPYVFEINGKKYRGDLEVRRLKYSDMTVINILPLNHYLYGVVPCEIEASSHPEALKAQAVAARTYTLNNLNKYQGFYFDLCTTVYSQVYRGYSVEKPSTNKAVDDTKGEKLTYKGKLAQAYYFSSSGGRTEDSKNVWGYDYPYLRSVEDKYESGKSWNYNWETIYTANDIEKLMKENSCDLGEILNVEVTKTSAAGRAIELVIQGTKGKQVYTNGKCRYALSSLHSQWYKISTDNEVFASGINSTAVKIRLPNKKVVTSDGIELIKPKKYSMKILGANKRTKKLPLVPSTYTFTGRGWGHAVGMSQEGAKGMAKAGYTYKEILTHYFQGTKVE